MIKRNNKRALYESIMKDVAKTVKRHLNERNITYKGDINTFPEIFQQIYNHLSELIGETLNIDINCNSVDIIPELKYTAIRRSVGHIIEAFILSELQEYGFIQTNNETFDAYFNDDEQTLLEIKAYNGKKSNITFTKEQLEKIDTLKPYLIYVNYEYNNGAVTIKEILFGSFNDVMNNKGSIGRSGGGRTRNMVSIRK